MTQYSLEGTGPPETRTSPSPSSPLRRRRLPFTLRIAEQPAPIAGAPALHSSQETADFIRPKIGAADRETFVILHMDVKNQVLDVELHGLGDSDSSAVYPRQVFRSALLRNASALIFCHNHPSGDPEPSLCDRQLTRDLVVGAHALGVKVLDHIIVGRTAAYFSFADKGLLDDYGMAASAALGQVRAGLPSPGPGKAGEDPRDYDDEPIDGVGFADPGGRSALRAATKRNPRNLPCPTCHEPNRLTRLDRARGYQCDACADRAEGGGY